ncbi:MAG: DUF151 domain-containing protein [Actinomycetota bacterium]|nr:DUF151 domain-containing protein [Actinomycetota bacterium]
MEPIAGATGGLTPNEGQLVAAARDGDRGAFAALVQRHRPMVIAVCRRMLEDPVLAEDAAQEAIVVALVNLDRLRRPERFGSWLAGIGLNLCRRWLRHRGESAWSWEALHGGGWDPWPSRAAGDPAELAEEDDLVLRVRQAVAALPSGQRGAVVDYYLLGLPQWEVARRLGTSVGAVKTRLHKARATLRQRLLDLREERPMTDIPAAVPMRVADVCQLDAEGPLDQYVVLLAEVDGDRQLPIWVGEPEATALAFALQEAELPRPMTYQFTAGVLEATGARLREARITRLAEGTYYAVVTLDGPSGTPRVDARPSDALNLAVLVDAPITVDETVLQAEAEQRGTVEIPSSQEIARDARAGAEEIVARRSASWKAQREELRRRLRETI